MGLLKSPTYLPPSHSELGVTPGEPLTLSDREVWDGPVTTGRPQAHLPQQNQGPMVAL